MDHVSRLLILWSCGYKVSGASCGGKLQTQWLIPAVRDAVELKKSWRVPVSQASCNAVYQVWKFREAMENDYGSAFKNPGKLSSTKVLSMVDDILAVDNTSIILLFLKKILYS